MASSSVPKYEVFLSSSSKDADNFSYLLHKGLEDKGILTLRGNQEVEGGGTASLDVIRQSWSAIVIISPDYASSPWLLQQLVQILQANNLYGMKVLPVFHLVNPSDVRHQRGTIGESLKKHVQYQVEEINRWRQALATVANFSGWNTGDAKDQTRVIKEIEEYVLKRIPRSSEEKKLAPSPPPLVGIRRIRLLVTCPHPQPLPPPPPPRQ
ncbi:toll/interleukin-1 receptor-like protein isoform X2 [Rosa chinensis]|uniref:toll/interleukin-1 receptor-like protein isoform X2 n=1 Tax=Rosa chinensis TaxID=74649 RepID=UPI000D08CF0A|nr:toll/interleukin-1 receptor-like protein isoform X2 [Rosa chinensis]